MYKPTSYLDFTLSGDDATTDRAASIKRSFSYVCPTSVAPGEANEVVLTVALGNHEMWDGADAEQNAFWNDTVKPWLDAKVNKVFNTLEAYNNEDARSFCGAIEFPTFKVVMEPQTVEVPVVDGRPEGLYEAIEGLRG